MVETSLSTTASIGSVSVVDMQVGLTGSICNLFNWISGVNDMTIGLTGQEFTASQGTATIPNDTAYFWCINNFTRNCNRSSTTRSFFNRCSFSASLGTVVIPNDVVQLSGVRN